MSPAARGSCRRVTLTCSRSGKPSKSRCAPPGSHSASPACRRRHRRHPLMRPWSYERLAEGVVLFLLAHGRGGAVAGKENESLGQCQDAFPDALQVNRVERGGVSPPDGAGEERVADERTGVCLVAHPTRRMAGGGHQADFFPTHLKRVPLARERAQAWRRLPAQQGPVPFPDVHGRWVARQDRVDPARVVGMAVRQADGSERQPVLLDRAEDSLGVVAGVDKDSMTGGRVVVEIPLHGIAADVAVDRDDVLDRVRDGMAWMPPVTGDGGQLGAIACDGWHPRHPIAHTVQDVITIHGDIGGYAVKGYLYHDPATRHAVLIDTGYNPEAVLRAIEEHRLMLTAICLTHGHADHASGIDTILARHPAPVYIGEGDWALLGWKPPPGLRTFAREGDTLQVGGKEIRLMTTPGHTPGGVCYQADACVFVGDTLFAGSIGRANPSTLYPIHLESVRKRVLTLPETLILFPGHGPSTTVREEKEHNPFG